MERPSRRQVLATLAVGAGGAVVGSDASPTVTGRVRDAFDGSSGQPAESGESTTETTLGQHGRPQDICEQPIREDFEIREIAEPAFAETWDGREIPRKYRASDRDEIGPLSDAATVIGLTAGDRARAYPVSVVWWHEVVNDTFGGPTLVTFCGICDSGMVASRVVNGEVTRFGVSGQLWRPPDLYARAAVSENVSFGARRWAANDTVSADVRLEGNLVLYDEATRSFWSQLLARGICGPLAGETLTQVPVRLTDWGTWRREHPNTDVLLPPPHSTLSE